MKFRPNLGGIFPPSGNEGWVLAKLYFVRIFLFLFFAFLSNEKTQ